MWRVVNGESCLARGPPNWPQRKNSLTACTGAGIVLAFESPLTMRRA